MGIGEGEPRRRAPLRPVEEAGVGISRDPLLRNEMGMEIENGKERQPEREPVIGGVKTGERLPP